MKHKSSNTENSSEVMCSLVVVTIICEIHRHAPLVLRKINSLSNLFFHGKCVFSQINMMHNYLSGLYTLVSLTGDIVIARRFINLEAGTTSPVAKGGRGGLLTKLPELSQCDKVAHMTKKISLITIMKR